MLNGPTVGIAGVNLITKLRPYRVEDVIESQFVKSDSKHNEQWAEEDLKRSGLEPDDLLVSAPGNLKLPTFAQAAYHIPYFDLEGRVITARGNYNIMWRVRYKLPQFSKDPRYLQPPKERLQLDGLPTFLPYLLPYPKEYDDGTIYCVEGEKKTGSVIKYCRVAAFGISGCQMWRNPDGTGGVHPWILRYLEQHGVKRVRIIPDADVLRYDMCQTYGTYAIALQRAGYDTELLHPTDKIDDLIVRNESNGLDVGRDFLENIERLKSEGLVQSPTSLAGEYNLAFRRDSKGNAVVHQHTSNVMKLMEEHDAFPTIWRNLDTNRVMVGESTATPDLTEMDIANHFQHQFGMEKITNRLVYSCIQALSKRNEKSPFLDYIRNVQWDQRPRLDSWLTRLWGVESNDYVKEISVKWLVSACARMDKPGSKVDWIFIVIGPQGTGKTSMPGILFKGNSLSLYGDMNDKDLHMLLHSALVVGFDELDSFGKRESSNLKAMITRNEDQFRPPYGAAVEVFPRRFTLYGCGNRYEFINHDPSGYRRYAVVEVSKLLNFAGLQSEVDQLWAEAWWRYKNDDLNWWEINNASEHAEAYVVPNIIEERIHNWIQSQLVAKHGNMIKEGELRFTMSQLFEGIGESGSVKNPTLTREVASILKALCCDYKSIRVGKTVSKHYIYKIGV